MKKLFITMAAVVAFAACSDDPAAWENLPTEPISGESAKLTVNGSTTETGSVQLTATSATQGTLLLTNVLPGYAKIEMDVNLSERADGTGTFDIEGKTGLTKIPAINARATEEPVIYNVSVTGSISPEGKIEVTLNSVLSTEAQGGLTGTWNLLTNVELNDEGSFKTAPLWITWSAKDSEQPNAEQTAMAVRQFGSSLLYQFLHSLTFLPDGTVTAEYWDGEGFDMKDPETGIAACLMSGFEYNDDWTGVFMKILRENPQWSESPKNLLYWYVKGDNLYIVPDIAAILAQIKQDTGSDVSGGLGSITDLLAGLGEYGIKVDALLPLVTQWMETGIPLKYEKTENGLKLSADKEMCGPVIEALLPALPKLDELIAGLANSEDPMMQMLPMILPSMLGVENLTQLDSIWKNNTNQFEISLNFEN